MAFGSIRYPAGRYNTELSLAALGLWSPWEMFQREGP